MKCEDITKKIIGAAYAVYNQLGFGFLESVYKKAMAIELAKGQLTVEQEKPLKVHYDGQIVGDFFVDLYVAESIVVELKSVQNLAKDHEVQLVNYLKGLNRDIGLLINFSPGGVVVKRKFREQKGRQDCQDCAGSLGLRVALEEKAQTTSPIVEKNIFCSFAHAALVRRIESAGLFIRKTGRS